MNQPQPDQIIAQWQNWNQDLSQPPLLISTLGKGLTNKSYLLDSNIGKLVLRINNPDSLSLGINRERENLILEAVSQISIGPEVIYQGPQYQYLVYRFIEGKLWGKTDLSNQQHKQRLRELINRYQRIELPIEPRNYKNYLFDYWRQLEEQNLIDEELQQQWSEFIPTLDDTSWAPCLSHHDLTTENIIESPDGSLKIIDWEYAHIGHPELDWASISGEYSSPASELLFWMNRLWTLIANEK